MNSTAQRVKAAQERLWRRVPALRPIIPKPLPSAPRLVLGRDNDGLPFALDARALAGHIAMPGGTGGGKSNTLRHLGWQQMETAGALIQIDPHGHHIDSLHRTTAHRAIETGLYHRQKVCVIDANSEWCTGLKLFLGSAVPSVMADHMIEAFERLQGDETLLEKPTLRRALHGLLAVLAELGLSLAEADLLLDPLDAHGLRAWALVHVRDRYATKALLRLVQLASNPRLMKEFEIETIGTENRLAPLLSSPTMRAIVGCQMLEMGAVLDQGIKLLVNTGGHDQASEVAGDLLGKLIIRTVLFAAKRRRTNTLALLIADECARYVSQDCERALAELRKFQVGVVLAYQTSSMLGKPGDPVREAIEKIPATKLVFRLNSMEEAITLAPEVVDLNLEMPVEMLRAPAVVGYELKQMRNANVGTAATHTDSDSTTTTNGTGTTRTVGETAGDSSTRTESIQRSLSHSAGRTRGTTESHIETDSVAESEGATHTAAWGATRGGGVSAQHGTSRGSNFGQSFDVPVDAWTSGERSYGRAAGFGVADARQVSAGYDRSESNSSGNSENWSASTSGSDASSWQRSHSSSVADGMAHSESETSHRDRSQSTAKSLQHSTGKTVGRSTAQGTTKADGWSEALVPVLKDRPTAVHSLQNVTYLTAKKLCSLPTGVAVVRTLKDGKVESAMVRVPERRALPVSDEQYAADLAVLVPHSGVGKPMLDAMLEIDEREQLLIAQASTELVPSDEPQEFRVPQHSKSRRRGGLQTTTVSPKKGTNHD